MRTPLEKVWTWAAVLAGVLALCLGARAEAQENTAPPAGVQVWNSKPVEEEVDLPAETPQAPGPIRIVGVRNGSFSGKIVLTSKQAMKDVRARMSDLALTNGAGRIPASAVEVRYGLYFDDVMCFDPLVETPPAGSPVVALKGRHWKVKSRATGNALQPIWVIVNVPADAAPGDYAGGLTVTVGEAPPFVVPVSLKVCGWTLPDPAQFRTLVGLIQSPESVALQYEVPLWSERHWQLVEQSIAWIGKLGGKTTYLHLMCETNQGNSESMVRWIRGADGSWKHDLSIVDRYLDLVAKHQGKPLVVCLYAWDRVFVGTADDPWGRGQAIIDARKELEGKGPAVTVLDEATGRTEKVYLSPYGTPESRREWKPLFDAIRARMKTRGWEDAMTLGLPSDLTIDAKTLDFFSEVCPGVPWMRHGHGSWSNLRIKEKGDDARFRFQACVLGRYFAYQRLDGRLNPQNERWHGWLPAPQLRHTSIVVHYPRQFFDCSTRCRYRMLGEVNVAGGQRGFGRIGADFWTVLKDKRGIQRGRIADRYAQNIWGHLTILLAVLHAGPDGAIPTARYQVMREGVQECEARIFIERAILDRKIDGPLAERCLELLDERVKALAEEMGTAWGYGDFHWESQRLDYPKFLESDWQSRSEKLYAAAAEVAARLAAR